ncbi:uncharacterized protein EAF01_003384 [Botrytis porri]|uniref:Uncharacterized protein n=1 Tax=Botrytis porri TaxID=87229 RepID=A0A4Z1KK11_9HELO|nr:uncharacterized protein EAF01_003384 [Botrytis porri]KAF7909666.1 hypothetical protein EAF01_003384 [Botrytis porri]TGO81533.1 hypothetical protein BPOR_1116g00010 [Botrytis porri]
MASHRSYKTSSYFPTNGSRDTAHRPPIKPSYSSSSSDEDIIASLKGLAIQSRTKEITSTSNSSTNSPRCGTPGTHVETISTTFDTPKKSDSIPISCGQSTRRTRVYTPLTGRGELPGGYFPGFADENTETLQSTILLSTSRSKHSPEMQPITISSMSSPMDSPASDTTVRGPPSIVNSPFTLPETLVIPKGKYYPSNYKPSPTSPLPSIPTAILNGGQLQLPPKSQRQKSSNPHHQRKSSDVKRKLQKYQKDMIEQARMVHASVVSTPGESASGSKPISPRLLPLGSPGPITPFELEESSGYLIAGQMRSGGLAQGELIENEAVARIIRMEEERRRREGQSSPAARV